MLKAIGIIRKVLALLPVITAVVSEVQAAQDEASPGGKTVTPAEIASIISHGLKRVGDAILDLFGGSGPKN